MIGLQPLTWATYWGRDCLRGSLIARQFKALKEDFADPALGQERACKGLEQLLEHAVKTTQYYRELPPDSPVSDFPVMQKRTLKENLESFLSSTVDRSAMIPAATSGSYGMPFVFFMSKEGFARRKAELLFFGSWVGFKVGKRYGQTLVHPRSASSLFLENGILLNPKLIGPEWLEQQRTLLKKNKIQFLVGYPSALGPIAHYCRSLGDTPSQFSVEGVISSSETLLDADRKNLEAVFGCHVVDRYACNELGIVSQECVGEQTQHVNFTGHFVELLAIDSDTAVENGATGRIVVTDLFSNAMPLIRYDTGDLASWKTASCGCGLQTMAFERVQGRLTERIFDPAGRLVNPLAICRPPREMADIVQFQFVQETPHGYLIRVHAPDSFDGQSQLHEQYQKLLGPNAQIRIERVKSIPRLKRSGKLPFILNHQAKNSG